MRLHVGYAKAKQYGLRTVKNAVPTTAILRTDKDAGMIYLDADTALSGVPEIAWSYRIGNRSAIDWVLDQYKEKTETDPTIRQKFDRYQFSDYKLPVIELLKRITTVSVETMTIV
jgi:predicted helicase